MNFGPLNRDGGERRLNVAVTRAKHEILVYSTLRSEQIDLSRTRAKGAEHLKAYLEYAERGPRALTAGVVSAEQNAYDSIFEKEVAEFLRGNGHEVHTQVGCSGYKIDLAIVAPESPGHYLLGIECDGATYHRASTARDRDRLRQLVLEGLGWKIHRIWSTDWWRNHEQAAADLLEAVEEAVERFKLEDEETISDEAEACHADESVANVLAAEDANIAPVAEIVEEEPIRYAGLGTASPDVAVAEGRLQSYPEYELIRQPEQGVFYEPTSANLICEQMLRIVECEGPILESVLMRRVAEEWGFGRAGAKIRLILKRFFPTRLAKSMNGEEIVFWPESVSPSEYNTFRAPTMAPQTHRTIEEIPLEELQNAVVCTLEKYISFPREDLKREVAKQFGISRLGKNVTNRLDETLILLEDTARIEVDEEVVKLVG